MKKLYLIGGTMGVGKTTVCQELKINLDSSVFLDGDWCWDSHPFCVTNETKSMVLDNICYVLNNFIHCSVYENIIFCWVMHQQSIIDEIISHLDVKECQIIPISLVCDERTLKQRLLKDVQEGKREESILLRSVERIPLYNQLNTIKIDTTKKSISEIVNDIKESGLS